MAMMTTHEGIKLAYEDRGAGKPAFVFIHGWTCNRSFCTPQVEYFARRHRVVSMDLRGHGESDKPQGPYPISAYAGDIADMIEQLALGKVIVVGYSMGGLAALQLSATYPDRVAAVVMVDPAPFASSPERQARAEANLAELEAGNQEPFREQVTNGFFLPTSDRKLIEDVLSVMMTMPSHLKARTARGILEFDALSAAAQCQVPALHIVATPPLNPPHLMSEWLPHVVHGWPVGGGHFSWLEVPDQVNSMIDGFLRHHV